MKNRSYRYNVNRPRSRHGHKYSTYKKCLTVMIMLTCIKQQLTNIWSSIHEKVKQHWGWDEKKGCFYKKKNVDLFVKLQMQRQWRKTSLPSTGRGKGMSNSQTHNIKTQLCFKCCIRTKMTENYRIRIESIHKTRMNIPIIKQKHSSLMANTWELKRNFI